MRPISSSLLHWLTIAGCAAAQNAYLYTLDIQPRAASSSMSSSIDSKTANAILARRLGATESMTLGNADDVLLELLGRYGGQQTVSIFGEGPSPKLDRLVVAIEGYDGTSASWATCCSLF
jgi:hypothetical protein